MTAITATMDLRMIKVFIRFLICSICVAYFTFPWILKGIPRLSYMKEEFKLEKSATDFPRLGDRDSEVIECLYRLVDDSNSTTFL